MASSKLIRVPSLQVGDQSDAPSATLDDLRAFVDAHPRLLVLTGAGLSTRSGIPAYRNAQGKWLRRDPILYQDFIAEAATRRRYWARSFFGWSMMQTAQPNSAHRALAAMEGDGRIELLVTQNVDGLHRAAGSEALVELHGALDRVSCLDCGEGITRNALQEALLARNPNWRPEVLGYRPDGDAELDASAYPGFEVVDCANCGGRLKPDVVFFGESVPPERAERIEAALAACDGLLVVGSSLVVMSGFRIVRGARALGRPVVAINDGRTRADGLLEFKVGGDCVEVLTALTEA
ncbi:NAD-dependent protein deacetylase [Wenzhouxiangella marina]|uniref:protein acetyllysine N-acetyltransferase n=1 Tax=Wenzhouxiangella marina TaxID=1579979 RepID=A0A0K0Y027_9GAMM|nr:NAD-dependent protein deacetylase [Wenzhouxiangella marina]AKS43242.1 NAD-dependent protein deacetylase [Wenzhouxiangella marina]MBB6087071.1 NAD-dependent SIR2 family protein deacetylase [Wenzhouxiangella marina]